MKNNIYYQIANSDPLWKFNEYALYQSGLIVWNPDNISFFGPFTDLEVINTMTNNAIEEWIEKKINSEIDKRIVEVKGILFQQYLNKQNRPSPSPGRVFKESEDLKKKPRQYQNCPWPESETEHLRKEFNNFIEKAAEAHSRSFASIKAKIYRLLQNSYGKV